MNHQLSRQNRQEINITSSYYSQQNMQENAILSSKHLKTKWSSSKYVLSYGAGVNSTALLFFLVKQKFPLDYVVFADTGNERPETYSYLEKHIKNISRKKVFPSK